MKRRQIGKGVVARGGRPRRTSVRAVRRLRGSVLGLGLGLVATVLTAGRGIAQTPAAQTPPVQDPWAQGRLTVRPREMATATRTAQAGLFLLDSFPYQLPDPNGGDYHYKVYVPPQCVGARRCPLLVHVAFGTEWRPVADKYGMILLILPANIVYADSGRYDSTGAGLRKIDAALQQVLRRFAIDPEKIAVSGSCYTADASIYIGGKNPDVFSRIVVINGGLPRRSSPLEWFDTLHKTTEIVFDNGTIWTQEVRPLLRAGYRVKHISSVRGHSHTWEMYDFLGQWLQKSWATPDPALRPAPKVIEGPLPVLTTEALAQMTTFWTRFTQEPDSIRTTARRAHLREVLVPVGEEQERPSTVMVDMAALATQYPSVTAALNQAGLTARQHDAYRLALFSALLFLSQGQLGAGKLWASPGITVTKGDSVLPALKGDEALAKNIAFLVAHPDEVQALADTHIWWLYP